MMNWFNKKSTKKARVALVACLALMGTAGTTYAWWTATAETAQTVTMGNLAISGNLAKPSSLKNWEPGLIVDTTGKIKNTGSIPALVKITAANQIQKATDPDFVDAGDQMKLSVGPKGSDVFTDITDDVTGKVAFWMTDVNKNVYLLLDPGMSVELDADTELVGDKMGNDTMGAKVNIGVNFEATQVLDGATKSLFGVSEDEFLPLDGESVADGYQFKKTRSAAPAKSIQYLKELMNRGK